MSTCYPFPTCPSPDARVSFLALPIASLQVSVARPYPKQIGHTRLCGFVYSDDARVQTLWRSADVICGYGVLDFLLRLALLEKLTCPQTGTTYWDVDALGLLFDECRIESQGRAG